MNKPFLYIHIVKGTRYLCTFAPVKKFPLLLILVTLVCAYGHAQDDQLRLISSSHSRLNASTGNIMNYRPVYEHQGSTLSADSGYIYNDELGRQFFDAFGKVIITQPNGTVIYADKLHYTAETQLATLTNNVRMVDDDAVLTTNFLTYNMKNSIGTYTGGGRIVNATDTITSQNAYYFDNTKDAYFRHDVVVRTPNVNIFTDTMRYNSASKMTYFYGPTNIKGHDGENLYTERGQYNTQTEQAWFDSNNLYTEGSRFLRGDSLYYDGKSGNGRAVDHVLFIDTADQFFAYGGIGIYQRENESITMTKNPLVITVTRNDPSPPDSTVAVPGDSLAVDSLTRLPSQPDSLRQDSVARDTLLSERPAVDSLYLTADTLFSQLIPLKAYIPLQFNLDREGGDLVVVDDERQDFTVDSLGNTDFIDDTGFIDGTDSLGADSLQVLPDSLGLPPAAPSEQRADTSRSAPQITDTLTNRPDSLNADTTAKTAEALLETHRRRVEAVAAPPKDRSQLEQLAADSTLRAQAIIPVGGEADSLMADAVAASTRGITDTLAKDSLASDTSKTRIVKAYYNVRLYKSDLQAVADSLYYGYPDSMMRFFGHPMIWAQGSQLTSDTIYMQIRNEKLDNMLMVRNAFLVNTQLDSSRFNQIKGRRITGFFANNALERLFVDGNAESIYYNVDEEKQVFTDMYHNRSSRIKILVDSNEITHFIPISGVDGKVYPLRLIPQEAEILDGFVWKPGDRPTSKADLLIRRRTREGESAITDEPDEAGIPDAAPAEAPPTEQPATAPPETPEPSPDDDGS
nr:OstA-like protein [Parapedobacter lycopersici]